MNNIKKDYTYVALVDKKSSQAIITWQNKLDKIFGTSGNVHRWPPHITISFGNLLSSNDLKSVKLELKSIAKSQKPFEIYFNKISVTKEIVEKNTNYYLTLKIKKNPHLEALSKQIQRAAQKHEIPYDKFTKYKFHVTLGKYVVDDSSKIQLEKITEIKTITKTTISSFSIYSATINDYKAKSAIEIETFNFN